MNEPKHSQQKYSKSAVDARVDEVLKRSASKKFAIAATSVALNALIVLPLYISAIFDAKDLKDTRNRNHTSNDQKFLPSPHIEYMEEVNGKWVLRPGDNSAKHWLHSLKDNPVKLTNTLYGSVVAIASALTIAYESHKHGRLVKELKQHYTELATQPHNDDFLSREKIVSDYRVAAKHGMKALKEKTNQSSVYR